jgi:hypothetical protein
VRSESTRHLKQCLTGFDSKRLGVGVIVIRSAEPVGASPELLRSKLTFYHWRRMTTAHQAQTTNLRPQITPSLRLPYRYQLTLLSPVAPRAKKNKKPKGARPSTKGNSFCKKTKSETGHHNTLGDSNRKLTRTSPHGAGQTEQSANGPPQHHRRLNRKLARTPPHGAGQTEQSVNVIILPPIPRSLLYANSQLL